MNSKINWNDSIEDFIKIKIHTPQLLTQLVQRQLQLTQKRNCEKKIKQSRVLYEEYSKQFRTQQKQFQMKTSFKRQIQKDIAKLALDISQLLKELLKQESDARSSKVKSEKGINDNGITNCTKKKSQKQLSQEFLISEYAVIKQNLQNQIEDLSNRGVNLKSQLNQLVKRRNIIQNVLQRQQGINMSLDQKKKIEQQLQNQAQLKIKLTNRIKQFQLSKIKAKKTEEEKEVYLEKTIKRIKDFSKQYKKIAQISQSRKNKKYNQFVKKYRIYDFNQQSIIKQQYQMKRQKKCSNTIEFIDKQVFKYQQPQQKMANYINRKFTSQEFNDLNFKCQNIQLQIDQRQNFDINLKFQIQALQEHLLRKTKQLQMQYKKIRNR